jgi:hypothetical protein
MRCGSNDDSPEHGVCMDRKHKVYLQPKHLFYCIWMI